MLINYSDVYGLAAVDIAKGSTVGEVSTFSTNYDGKIKGLLVKRQNGDVVLVEPSRVLGVGAAAAVIDLDEQLPVVSPEHIETSRIIGRPVISLTGDPVGKLTNCRVDLEAMEIIEFRLLAADGETERLILPGQVRTLGRHFIILNREAEVPAPGQEVPAPVQERVSLPTQAALLFPAREATERVEEVSRPLDDLQIPSPEPIETAKEPDLVPVTSERLHESPMGSLEGELVKDTAVKVQIGYEPQETLPSPDLGAWQNQMDALVDKSMERTLVLDNGGAQKTLQVGEVITKEIIEDLAAELPSILDLLPLFVK